MFKMVSRSGAAIRYTNSFRKREELLRLGYTEEKKKAKTPRKKNEKKEKINEKENTDRTKNGL